MVWKWSASKLIKYFQHNTESVFVIMICVLQHGSQLMTIRIRYATEIVKCLQISRTSKIWLVFIKFVQYGFQYTMDKGVNQTMHAILDQKQFSVTVVKMLPTFYRIWCVMPAILFFYKISYPHCHSWFTMSNLTPYLLK